MDNKRAILVILVSVLLSVAGMTALITLDTPVRQSIKELLVEETAVTKPTWSSVCNMHREEEWMQELDADELLELKPINYTSDVFEIKGKDIRLVWVVIPAPKSIVFWNSFIMIDIMYANGTRFATRGSSGYGQLSGDIFIEPGEYYLEAKTLFVEYFSVTVWEYY